MIHATIPIDEARRLFALRRLQILDTDAEPAFDHITQLARQLFDVPMALISFVDRDRQWFKSRAGLDVSETPRDISFCGHTILEERTLIVNDARADTRFNDNPLVLGEPNIRFYAGVPLHAPTGERIGTLCILDTRERQFNDSELAPLRALAGIVDDMLCRSDDALRAAFYDALTGLPNKLLLQEKLSQTLNYADAGNRSIALLTIALDQLRDIAQAFGHAAGDDVMQTSAQRLSKHLGSTAIIGRSDANELTVFLADAGQTDALDALCAAILRELNEPIAVNQVDLSTTASIGVSLFPQHGRSSAELFTCADTALTQARADGGNCWQIYSADAQIEPNRRLELYHDIKLALAHNEFELYYQTEIDIASGEISGIETFLRWNHPRLGLLLPADFIDAAEESGLIVPIGEWVLQKVCCEAEMWLSQGLLPCAVAINISTRQLIRSNFEEIVSLALQHSQLPSSYLELEFDESMLNGDHEQNYARLQKLHDLGVRLTINDFGSGYSNLAQLSRLAFDKLKIDQSYIRKLNQADESKMLVKMLIEIAHNLQLKTVANGVETIAQLEQLRTLGCDSAQGFLFSKPMRAAAMHALLHSQRLSAGNQPSPKFG